LEEIEISLIKKIYYFLETLIKRCFDHDILGISYELTYKLIFALFPFLIFLLTIIGFLNLDGTVIITELQDTIPREALEIIEIFVSEVVDVRHGGLLTGSLIVAIFSASSGFSAVMRGINRSYGVKETRSFLLAKFISIVLVIIFTITIVFSLGILIYGGTILSYIINIYTFMELNLDYAIHLRVEGVINLVSSFTMTLAPLLIMVVSVMIIYWLGSAKKVTFTSVMPGSVFTVSLWVISSYVFSMYIEMFSRHTIIYGSMGSVFILMLWLNLISLVLVLGSEINSMIKIEKNKSTLI
jgi:membrane protein